MGSTLDNFLFIGAMGLDAKQDSRDRFPPIIITSLTTIAELPVRGFEQSLQEHSLS